MLIRVLTNRGHVCVGAQDGREAVVKYKEEKEKLLAKQETEMHNIAVKRKVNESESNLSADDVVEESIRSEPYDTILMDYEMPVLNGPAATKQLRDMGCTCLIVGITGNVLPEDVKHFKACGAQAVLPKPLKFMDLETIWSQYYVSVSEEDTIKLDANASSSMDTTSA